MSKKAQVNGIAIAFGVILLVFLGHFAGMYDLKSTFGVEGTEDEPTTGGCDLDNVALTVGSNRLGQAGTEPSEGFRMFVNGLDKGTKAEDSSTDVTVGADYVIYAGENATAYYTVKKTGNVDCQNPFDVFAELPHIDTTVTYVITNDDGTLNSAAALSIDQDEKVTIEIKSTTTANDYYGNPSVKGNNKLTCVANKTMFRLDIQEPEYTSSGTPNIHTAGMTYTGNGTTTFNAPGITSASRIFKLDIEAIGDSDPGAAEDIVCYEYDYDYDLNADTLAEILAVEDEDFNDLGSTTTQSFTIDIS